MFSDHFQKIERAGSRSLFLIAAAIVMVCQLVAMALVADGQVKKAELRDSQWASQRVAIAQCLENKTQDARQGCELQARQGMQFAALQNTADEPATVGSDFSRIASPVAMQSLMAVSFAPR